ncbi:MAG TPA: hypothetical protein VMY76_02025 [Gemmatimonadales bacterium]|nr:hypothetical protein [Gemmatimonadales bacterium]
MRQRLTMVCAAWLAGSGCGEGGTTGPAQPGDGGTLARQFEQLADSVADVGDSTTSNVLQHAAAIVRLTGHASPVVITIDGRAQSFLAVAEQLDFPSLRCSWPGDTGVAPPPIDTIGPVPPGPDTLTVDSVISLGVMRDSVGETPPDPGSGGCTVDGTTSMRTFIAWEPERMAQVVRIVADVGRNDVEARVPDVMNELPTVSGDSAGGGGSGFGGTPGFFGQYLVRELGSWYTVEGSQSNAQDGGSGPCTERQATFDWAEFNCEAAGFRFEFDMRVEPLRYEALAQWAPGSGPAPDLAEGSHTLAMVPSAVDGVRLTVAAWTPPPPLPPPGPGPDPIPVDSAQGGR